MNTKLILCLSLALAGCAAPIVYVARDGGTNPDAPERAKYECDLQQENSPTYQRYMQDPLGNLASISTIRKAMKDCMHYKGFEQVQP